jgi:hypothetical protein
MAFFGTSTGSPEANLPSLLPRSVRCSGGILTSPRTAPEVEAPPATLGFWCPGFSLGFHASVTLVAAPLSRLAANSKQDVVRVRHGDAS